MENRVCEYAIGGFGTRGNATWTNNFLSLVKQSIESGRRVEFYRSFYSFDDSALGHFRLYKTIKGYTGTFAVSSLLFDIDKKLLSDTEVLDRARNILNILKDKWGITSYRFWYSGSGYHIETPDFFGFPVSTETPRLCHETVKYYFSTVPGIDLTLYDRSQIVRSPGSFNIKSSRWKILIPWQEVPLITSEEVILRAQDSTRALEGLEATSETLIAEQLHTPLIVIPPRLSVRTISKDKGPLTSIITCMQKAFNEGELPGTRHKRLLRLASVWHRQGLPQEACIKLGREYTPTLEGIDVERTVHNVFQTGYTYSCSDEVMREFCDPRCIYFKSKNYGLPVVSISRMEEEYVTFLHSDAFVQAIDLAKVYRNIPHYYVFPGEFVAVIGDTKLGKSAWMQGLCIHWNQKKILYLSLETPQNLMYRRFLQIKHGFSKTQIYEHYAHSTNTLSAGMEHIQMMTVSPNLDDVARIMSETASNVAIIDTLDCITTPGIYNDNEKTSAIARTLRDIAQRMNTIVFGVHHISKGALLMPDGKPRPLDIHSGKNSSSIEQKADKVIGIEGDRNSPLRTIKSLGARDEEPILIKATFSRINFRFTQIN